MAPTLEAALDELYAAKPEDFVAARAALAKKHGKELGELKKGGGVIGVVDDNEDEDDE